MIRSPHHRSLLALLALAPALLSPALLYGQPDPLRLDQGVEPEPATIQEPPTTPEGAAPEAVPLAKLPSASEAVLIRLGEILARNDTTAIEIEIKSRMAELDSLLNYMTGVTDRQIVETSSVAVLVDMNSSWKRALGVAEAWLTALQKQTAQAVSDLKWIQDERTIWIATRQEFTDEDIPAGIRSRIDTALAALERDEAILLARRDEILELQNVVVSHHSHCRKMLDRIHQAAERQRMRLFETETPPLWKAFDQPEVNEQLRAQARDILRTNFASLAGYFRYEWVRLALHGAFTLVLLALFTYLRNRAGLYAMHDKSFAAAEDMLRPPIAGALLVAVLIGGRFHEQPPRLLITIENLLLLVPLFLLLPKLVPKSARGALVMLGLLFVLDEVSELLPTEMLLSRMVNYLVCTVALIGIHRVRRLLKLRELGEDTKYQGLFSAMTQIGRLCLIAAIVLDVLGSAALAQILIQGTLTAFYAAILLWGTVRLLKALFSVGLRSRLMQALRMVRHDSQTVQFHIFRVVNLATVLVWILIALKGFGIREEVLQGLHHLLFEVLSVADGTFSLGDVLIFILVLWLSFSLSQGLRYVMEMDVLSRVNLAPGLPTTISRLTHYLVLVAGFFLAASLAGFDLNRFTLLAGALGVGIGFGLQNIVNNFVSGLVLLFERPIKVGDRVEVGNLLGDVKHIGIRSSVVRALTGAEVVVPNGNLISNEVTNWTLSDQLRRVDIDVGVRYGTDPQQVLAILRQVATSHEDVLREPAPAAWFLGFGESSLDFSLRAWTGQTDKFFLVRSDLNVAVNRSLKEAGIEIPFPQRDLHVRSVDQNVRWYTSADSPAPPPDKPAPEPVADRALNPTPETGPAPDASCDEAAADSQDDE